MVGTFGPMKIFYRVQVPHVTITTLFKRDVYSMLTKERKILGCRRRNTAIVVRKLRPTAPPGVRSKEQKRDVLHDLL